ncbi:MAG: hypothetical protein K2L38_04270, partial [Dysosmobacter sp.]|nr:hypothetical protein [Dysosmobacter sp.]
MFPFGNPRKKERKIIEGTPPEHCSGGGFFCAEFPKKQARGQKNKNIPQNFARLPAVICVNCKHLAKGGFLYEEVFCHPADSGDGPVSGRLRRQ